MQSTSNIDLKLPIHAEHIPPFLWDHVWVYHRKRSMCLLIHDINSDLLCSKNGRLVFESASIVPSIRSTVYPNNYAHGFCYAVLCCGYTLTDFPISIRLTSLALWQSNDCLSASKATLMNMDKYFMWIHYERLHNHNKAKHNKTVCIFLGIYCAHWE